MNVFDLSAKLTLDTSEYESSLNRVSNQTEGKAGGGISKGFKVATAAIAAATTAVAAFAGASVKTGAEFDKSMSQVAATMGYTVEELNTEGSEAAQTLATLRDFAMDMGSKTAFSATQASEALNYMALAGYDAETSMSMLPNVLNLAASGGMELAAASDMVTDAQSALGLSLEETGEMVDMMAAAASKSNTSVSQLGEAILTIGGTAKLMSGGTAELSTALGILADNGIKGAEGGTHLRNVLLSLSAPTDEAAGMLARLGVNAVDANGDMLPLQDIMQQLSSSLEGLGEAEKAEIISSIFNKTDIAAVNALLNTSVDRWEELGAAIEDSEGAAEAMAAVQLDNLAGDITLFKSALEGAKILISDGLTPTLRSFVQFGTEGLTRITDAFKADGLSGAMEAFGDILNDGLNMIVEMAPQIVQAAVTLLLTFAQGIIDNLPTTIQTIIDIIVENLPILIQGAIQLVAGLVAALPEIIAALIAAIPDILAAIIEGFAPIVEQLGQVFSNAWEAIKNIFAPVGEWFTERKEDVQNAFAAVDTWFSEKFEAAKNFVHSAWESIGGWFGERWADIQGAMQSADSWFSEKFTNAKNAVHTAWSGIGSFFTEKWTEIKNVFSNAWDIFKGIGGNIVKGLIAGITEWIGSAIAKARELIQRVKGAANSEAEIASPSKAFRRMGRFIDEGLMLGIEDEDDKPVNAITRVMKGLKAAGEGLRFTSSMNYASRGSSYSGGEDSGKPIIIQVVLDGKVIGETSYNYIRRRTRMVGA